ncbi:MAG TPA: hypothetical protein VE691_12325 [Rubrobacter sp.]|jgi:dihydroorotase-like cyclic amidohydrolase|nr:hypothetical protein [Rubrobacter sp.]
MSGLLFSGGTVVSAEGSYQADVLVEDEKIVARGVSSGGASRRRRDWRCGYDERG